MTRCSVWVVLNKIGDLGGLFAGESLGCAPISQSEVPEQCEHRMTGPRSRQPGTCVESAFPLSTPAGVDNWWVWCLEAQRSGYDADVARPPELAAIVCFTNVAAEVLV